MLWSGIRSIVGIKTKNQLTQISHLLENGNRVDGSTKMASTFDNYFVNVGSNIDKSIPRIGKSPTDYLKNRNDDSMFHSRNSQKAIGPCSIPLFLLKTFDQAHCKTIICIC